MDSSSESDSEDDDDDSEESDRDSDDPTAQLIKSAREEAEKAERKIKKNAAKAQALELAKKRKKKEAVSPPKMSLTGRQDRAPIECFSCGGPHLKKDCPQGGGKNGFGGKRQYQGGHGGNSKKARTSR